MLFNKDCERFEASYYPNDVCIVQWYPDIWEANALLTHVTCTTVYGMAGARLGSAVFNCANPGMLRTFLIDPLGATRPAIQPRDQLR